MSFPKKLGRWTVGARRTPANVKFSRAQPSTPMSNLCDLFLQEVATLRSCASTLRAELWRLAEPASRTRVRPLLRRIDRINRTQFQLLEDALAAAGVALPDADCPAMHGLLREGEMRLQQAIHASVGDAAVIAVLRRMSRYMETSGASATEAAGILGFDELENILSGWNAAWRGVEPLLKRAALQSSAEAYLADVNSTGPMLATAIA